MPSARPSQIGFGKCFAGGGGGGGAALSWQASDGAASTASATAKAPLHPPAPTRSRVPVRRCYHRRRRGGSDAAPRQGRLLTDSGYRRTLPASAVRIADPPV